jgi:hypothetical protein
LLHTEVGAVSRLEYAARIYTVELCAVEPMALGQAQALSALTETLQGPKVGAESMTQVGSSCWWPVVSIYDRISCGGSPSNLPTMFRVLEHVHSTVLRDGSYYLPYSSAQTFAEDAGFFDPGFVGGMVRSVQIKVSGSSISYLHIVLLQNAGPTGSWTRRLNTR